MEATDGARSLYIGLMLILPAVAAGNSIVHGLQIRDFLQRTPAFSTYQNIVDFEKIVARQMYAALAQIGLLVTPGIVFVVGLVRDVLTIDDVLYVILPSFVIIALGVIFKKVENQVRAIPVSDPILAERRNHIIEVWNNKAFPDW